MTRNSEIPFVIAMLCSIAIPLVPVATADYAPGSTVGTTDSDHSPWAKDLDQVVLCYIDPDGSGAYNPGEPLVLHFATTCVNERVAYEDLVIVGVDGPDPGHEVELADPEHGRFLHGSWTDDNGFVQLEHTLAFIDYTGEGEWSDDNVLYLDLFNVGSLRVDAGDVRITGWRDEPAFSIVENGDDDVAIGLNQLNDPDGDTPSHTLFSDGGDASTGTNSPSHVLYEAGKGFYINGDGDDPFNRTVEKEDIRLNGVPDLLAARSDPAHEGAPAWTLSGLHAPNEVPAGGPFTIRYVVENTGDGAGAVLVNTTMGGEVVDARGTPTLAPGERATLVVTLIAPVTPGEVSLTVGPETATLTVVAEPAPTGATADLSPLHHRIDQLEEELAQLQTRATVQTSQPPSEGQAPAETVQGSPFPALLPSLAIVTGAALVVRQHRA